jgi:hypothetical protein
MAPKLDIDTGSDQRGSYPEGDERPNTQRPGP